MRAYRSVTERMQPHPPRRGASRAFLLDLPPEPAHRLRRSAVGPDGSGAVLAGPSLCAETDPEAFFPEKGGSTREAKRVCVRCDVRAECLEYALANDERFGIWGGLSERERRRIRLARRTALSA